MWIKSEKSFFIFYIQSFLFRLETKGGKMWNKSANWKKTIIGKKVKIFDVRPEYFSRLNSLLSKRKCFCIFYSSTHRVNIIIGEMNLRWEVCVNSDDILDFKLD